jgi:hypothetical protein
MAGPTVGGASRTGISSLTHTEHQAAINALKKLSSASGATHGVASVLGAHLVSATQSGGSVHEGTRGADTFAGGVHTGATPSLAIGSDTVVAGSGFSGKIESAGSATAGSAHALSLSGDTINVAGTTAASVKTEPLHEGKITGQTLTLSDKTTITLTGVSAHDVTKAH